MLYELTGTYGASISAARAPKGLFGPKSLFFVTPFWAKFYFGWNIGMWGVQSAALERPAQTALLQSIWNHPAEENDQNVKMTEMYFYHHYLLKQLCIISSSRILFSSFLQKKPTCQPVYDPLQKVKYK